MKELHMKQSPIRPVRNMLQKLPPVVSSFWLITLLLIVAAFHIVTVRQGHIWGDDFAMYVHHAKNIVEGKPYTATGYLFDPSISVSPRMYPPVLPLFLAPVVRLFGLNLLPMKIEQVIFFVLVLAVVSLYWRRDLGPECTLALVAILGFSPHFWAAKDNVLSDLLFLLFFYVAALLVQHVPRCEGNQWRWAVLTGFALYLAIGTRTAGVALIARLLLHDLVKYRTVTRITVIALSTCAGLIFLQSSFLSSGFSGYAGQAHPTMRRVAAHLISYPRTLAGFWVASTQTPFSFLVLGIVSLFTLVGFWNLRRQGITAVEAFLVPYAAMVLLWPFSPGIRLVFPFIPWMVFLALSGLRTLTAQLAPRSLLRPPSAHSFY